MINKIWLAGFFDGEGCITSAAQTIKGKYEKYPRVSMQILIAQKDRVILEEIQKVYGGTIKIDNKKCHHLRFVGKDTMGKFLGDIYPYSVCKKSQIKVAFKFLDTVREENLGCTPLSKEVHNLRSRVHEELKRLKEKDFNFPCPLDMTNISVNYDDDWLYSGSWAGNEKEHLEHRSKDPIFLENCLQAMSTGEPGFSFNFGDKENETLRNACCEVTSEDDSDVCNLGSINLGNISSLNEFKSVVELASKFLVCGTLRADLPYDKVYAVREKNRRLGLGLMGVSEWLLQRGERYEVTPELHKWLEVYKNESERAANEHCERLFISKPVAYRAIAPTGSLGILAGTTTGIEPLFAVAYKRRYLSDGTKWKYEYVVDSTADLLIREYGLNPDNIDTAYKLSHDYERRIRFQADIQDYVDMSISSTINLPSWGSRGNTETNVSTFAEILAKYAPRLRGFTCYPDGSRGGQPLTEVSYEEAMKHKGMVFAENDICDITGKGGSCGI